MRKLTFAFLGATNFSKEMLTCLIDNGYLPRLIFYIPEEFSISYSRQRVKNFCYADLKVIGNKYSIQTYEVDSVRGKRLEDYASIIQEQNLYLILVLGWYYMVPKAIRELAKHGAWGIHASLLPKYAGGAPLVWAMINGEKEAGVTLFRLGNGVDDGDIIAQESFEIDENDYISDVYSKAAIASKKILLNALENISSISYIPQKKEEIQVYPQRKPEDGKLDWAKTAREIYNFIRAQSIPYPCAYSLICGDVVHFVTAEVTTIPSGTYKPGTIVKKGNNAFVATKDYFLKPNRIRFRGQVIDFNNFVGIQNIEGEIFD